MSLGAIRALQFKPSRPANRLRCVVRASFTRARIASDGSPVVSPAISLCLTVVCDVHIDAIQQGTGDFIAILPDHGRRTTAFALGISIESTQTGVHCRHNHKIRGQGHYYTVFVPCSWTTVSYHLTQFRDQVLLICLRSKLCGYSQTQLLLLRRQNLSGASESAAADIHSPREQSAANENLVVSTCGIHCCRRKSSPKKKSPATPWYCRGRRWRLVTESNRR